MSNQDSSTLKQLGKYRIESVLGQGGMGVVYKGYDPVIDRPVALKTIRSELLQGTERATILKRLQQEARAVGRCPHPNIVAVFDYGEDQGIPYIAMEYVQGQSLGQSLDKGTNFQPNSIRYVISQVLTGLDCAHRHGVIHRDIKPDNVLILDDGHVKVTDFGIARLESSTQITRTGVICGTPNYMAPEQIRGGTITQAVDIYATGALMYELCTGNMPFSGANSVEVLYNVLENTLDLDSIELDIADDFRAILSKALAKNPDDRFHSAQEFANALMQPEQPVAVATMQSQAEVNTEQVEVAMTLAPATPVHSSGVRRLTPSELAKVEEDLARHVGPIAKHIVKKASRETDSVDEFCSQLSQNLDDEAGKNDFERRLRNTLSAEIKADFSEPTTGAVKVKTRNTASSRSPDEKTLTVIEQELMLYLGPIARILVQKQAGRTASAIELYQQLASHIPNPEERSTFLKNMATSVH